MSGLKSWWIGFRESFNRWARLHHETEMRIIRDRIERDPIRMLDRIRKLEKELAKIS
jgi:hypothetical protein